MKFHGVKLQCFCSLGRWLQLSLHPWVPHLLPELPEFGTSPSLVMKKASKFWLVADSPPQPPGAGVTFIFILLSSQCVSAQLLLILLML